MNRAALLGTVALVALLLAAPIAVSCARLSAEEVRQIAESTAATHFARRVDPIMIRAMVETESSRWPCAIRFEFHLRDASIGLMQTLTATAQDMWDNQGYRAFPRPDGETLVRPEVSIYFGAAYIDWLSSWGGRARSERWIVESYNGGPGNSNGQTQAHLARYLRNKGSLTNGP